MTNKILVIEDVIEISGLVSMYLENAGFEVAVCENAELALEKLQAQYVPNLILLDLNLPGMSGFDFLKKVREDYKKSIPIIIVSARDSDEDIIKGLGFGADEFVTKPFSPKVLVARVQAKLNRLLQTEATMEETISFGEYTLYCNSCILKKGTEKMQLSAKEYEVLEYLCRNKDKAVTPEQIYQTVWKTQFGDVTAVAVYIQRLRKKIEVDPAKPEYITTEFGNGYKFVTK